MVQICHSEKCVRKKKVSGEGGNEQTHPKSVRKTENLIPSVPEVRTGKRGHPHGGCMVVPNTSRDEKIFFLLGHKRDFYPATHNNNNNNTNVPFCCLGEYMLLLSQIQRNR